MSKKKGNFTVQIVIEAIGEAREVVLESDPKRDKVIESLGGNDTQVFRATNDKGWKGYFQADTFIAAGFEVGTRATLILKPMPKPVGAPVKIVDEKVTEAIRKVKGKPTQKAVAEKINVSERTLRDWLKRNDKSWQEVKREALKTVVP